ncbi:MAG: hypothetical protein E6G33_14160 [Actinobacteria bacterium]|nr:MAG: hypothetical protein E6G33_14160 [Actinomycetota bacterium]
MLFLGLGTGLGAAPGRRRYGRADGARPPAVQEGDLRGLRRERGRARLGKKEWEKAVAETIDRLTGALEPDYVVLGGGNAKKLAELGPNVRLGANDNAFVGAFRLWDEAMPSSLTPPLGQGV